MKPTRALGFILLAISLDGCHWSSTNANTNCGDTTAMHGRTQEVAEVMALEDLFAKAFRAKDVNTIMQLCVPDDSLVVFDVQRPLQVNGVRDYRLDWENFFNRFSGPLEADVSGMDVTAGDDVAYVRYIHHVMGPMKYGKRADYTLRVTDCLRKINGKWLIAHTHVSVPVDMQTGEADLESRP